MPWSAARAEEKRRVLVMLGAAMSPWTVRREVKCSSVVIYKGRFMWNVRIFQIEVRVLNNGERQNDENVKKEYKEQQTSKNGLSCMTRDTNTDHVHLSPVLACMHELKTHPRSRRESERGCHWLSLVSICWHANAGSKKHETRQPLGGLLMCRTS